MKILALDIGAGTKDVFLYDSEKNLENCIKMVLPSPTSLYVARIKNVEDDLYIDGCTIGGGSLVKQLKEHTAKGYRVFISEEAAFTLYNDIDTVKTLGLTVIEKPLEGFNGEHIKLDEVDIMQLKSFFASFMETLEDLDGVAISVQDHGAPSRNIGQNKFRLIKFQEHFTKYPEIHEALFSDEEVPKYYLRMNSAVGSARKALPETRIFVMDSTIAAIAGCICDLPRSFISKAVAAVNIGNSHITAAIVKDNRIISFMEHHTSLVKPKRLETVLKKLGSGTLENEEITAEGGHGVFYLTQLNVPMENTIVATGPNRGMVKKTSFHVHFAAPSGDVMMTGAFGLVKAAESRLFR